MKIKLQLCIVAMFALMGIHISYVDAQQKKDLPEMSFDALNYVITLNSIDCSARTISGNTEMACILLKDNQNILTLDFISLTADSVLVSGNHVSFVQTDSTLLVDLPSEIVEGDTISIKTYYHGHPYSDEWGGVIFNGEYVYNLGVGLYIIPHNLARSWFPCFDSFYDKATFEYYITVSSNKKAICGGLLIDVVDNADSTSTYHWKTDISLSPYTASFTVGDYELTSDTCHSLYDNREIPITLYMIPAYSGIAKASFANLSKITNIFEEKFGPYCFERIGYSGTSIGCMEHQNNISFANGSIGPNLNCERLYAHELSHSWFGNLITCLSAEDMWINEGWAEFCQNYYQEVLYGKTTFRKNMDAYRVNVLSKAHTSSEDGDYYALNNIPQTNTYGISAYERGSLVVQSLRDYLTDSIFFNSVKNMLAFRKFTTMSSYDLCSALSETSGVNLNDFFHNFVYQPGATTYIIDSCVIERENNNSCLANVYVQQKLYHRSEYSNSNRVNIVFMDSLMNTYQYRVYFDGQAGHASFNLNFIPVAVYVDYFHNSYAASYDGEKIFTKNGLITFSNTGFKAYVDNIVDSTYCHVNHNLVTPNDAESVNGYRLSSTHFWKIDLIKYGAFNSKGLFNYVYSGADSDLITNNNSIVLMYRSVPSEQWTVLPTTHSGSNSVGDLILDTLRSGEYTFAVVDSTHYGIAEYNDKSFNIYPNPSDSFLNIFFNENVSGGVLQVFDMKNRLIDSIYVKSGISNIKWYPTSQRGQYFIFIFTDNRKKVEYSKAIYITR